MPELNRLSRAVVPDVSALPERAVQFGTGAFLRGFIDYFIDAANRGGCFGGTIVAIGSTGSGRDQVLNEQDGHYTLAVRGIENGERVVENRLIRSLSRALSAATEWDQVLSVARDPHIELIFSNTTETGIRIENDDAFTDHPPKSFPAKLTRFLAERADAFDYAPECGVVVLPCELIDNNGAALKALVLELARRWHLDARFSAWLERHVPFCNTLVDRIVPGEPNEATRLMLWQQLGYRDDLLTMCEPYRLYAIEADTQTAARLRFTAADPAIIVAADITPFRQRKLRLLNGTHSISVPVALLAGCATVAEAVNDELVGGFIRSVLFNELVTSTDVADADTFARQVLDRFANPYIRHELIDITLQQTLKLRVRIVPAIHDYIARAGEPPKAIALGLAAYIHRAAQIEPERADDLMTAVRAALKPAAGAHDKTRAVLGCMAAWQTDLNEVAGLTDLVAEALERIEAAGVRAAITQLMPVAARA